MHYILSKIYKTLYPVVFSKICKLLTAIFFNSEIDSGDYISEQMGNKRYFCSTYVSSCMSEGLFLI